MKKMILLGTAFLAVLHMAAQQPDAVQVMVHYKFSHLQDTNNRANVYTENMVLLVGKNSSIYRSYEPDLKKAVSKNENQPPLPGGRMVGYGGSGTIYFQFPNEKKFIQEETFMGDYLMEEAWPVINWKISQDTATMGGLHCQKATTHFKGRDYTAWFCPDIPVHAGPWKLNGLPGVIMEAWDSRKEVQFLFSGIDKINGPQEAIKLPADAVKTTFKDYTKMKDAMNEDPAAMGRALTIQAGGIPGKSGPQVDIKIGPKKIINNPVELPEKR